MKKIANQTLALLLISFLSLFLNFRVAGGGEEAAFVPLTIDNEVLPGSSKNFLADPRVFNAEFYRKFYPQVRLENDADATRDWMIKGAKACRRGSFLFYSRDYPTKVVSELLGHSSVQTTLSIYRHVDTDDFRTPMNEMTTELLCDVTKLKLATA